MIDLYAYMTNASNFNVPSDECMIKWSPPPLLWIFEFSFQYFVDISTTYKQAIRLWNSAT